MFENLPKNRRRKMREKRFPALSSASKLKGQKVFNT